MSDRLQREKDYHNKAFSEGIRQKVDKYYSIHKTSLAYLYQVLEQHATGRNVLEYGCGPGHNAFFLAKHAKSLVAIDISDYAIRTAAQKAKEDGLHNIQFKEMNAEELEFENESFDLIFGNSIIHHLDLHKSYQEIKRVLKPGGRAVFYEPLGHNVFINLYRKLTPEMRTEDEHPLLVQDINLAGEYFNNITVRYFHLTTIMSVPFRNTIVFKPLLGFLSFTDRVIFRALPFMRRQAWFCVIQIVKE